MPIPIVIGVSDIRHHPSNPLHNPQEPLSLILQSIKASLTDTYLSPSQIAQLQQNIDHIGIVNTWTWLYSDLPSLIAQKLGVDGEGCKKVLSHHGGDSPCRLFDEASRAISKGESKVAVVCGGEALASCESSSFVLI